MGVFNTALHRGGLPQFEDSSVYNIRLFDVTCSLNKGIIECRWDPDALAEYMG